MLTALTGLYAIAIQSYKNGKKTTSKNLQVLDDDMITHQGAIHQPGSKVLVMRLASKKQSVLRDELAFAMTDNEGGPRKC